MAKVVDTANPHHVLFEGPSAEAQAFKDANEPRPHVESGRALYQLELQDDAPPMEEE
jgi:hypothetical protein